MHIENGLFYLTTTGCRSLSFQQSISELAVAIITPPGPEHLFSGALGGGKTVSLDSAEPTSQPPIT